MVKITSWNVNSLRVRLPQLLQWCASEHPDIVALQEIKLQNDAFPYQELADAGYQAICNGQKTYNGVAMLSRAPPSNIIDALPGMDDPQRRLLAASYGELRVVNVYVPNGQSVGSEKYSYKLAWLHHLAMFLKQEIAAHPQLILLGDFNIAPADADVHDPAAWHEQILCSTAERQALRALLDLGLIDSYRQSAPEGNEFSWWDYRLNGFKRNLGLRIDLTLASTALYGRHHRSWIDKTPRGWERPSDHAPVVAEFQ
ncbi:MAG: exodeoxyribonuclease III [Gammaproteobacteria bacterium]|nr:exodeoxyribonuclease III [Gammaproteobacteria bacterium]